MRSLRTLLLAATAAAAIFPPAGAQEAEDDPEARKEALLRLLQSVEEGASKAPSSVLDGFDPRLATAADLRTFRALRGKRMTIALEKAEVSAALDILRAATGLNFVVSAKAKEALAAEKPSLTMQLDDLPVENVLNLVALQLPDMRFAVRYGTVVLVRKEEWRPRRILRVYEVSDLIRKPPDFPAPKLGLGDIDPAAGR
jgi:hypothetical protein